jgi:Mitochondrial carrier protein
MNQDPTQSPQPNGKPPIKKLSFAETVQNILAKDGVKAFWRGIGPGLILVINPVLQYTVFEQLKNILLARRRARLRAAGLAVAAAVLSDWDFFFLGALSKLGASISRIFRPSCDHFTQLQHLSHTLICESSLTADGYVRLTRHWYQCGEKSTTSRPGPCSEIQVFLRWPPYHSSGGRRRRTVQRYR